MFGDDGRGPLSGFRRLTHVDRTDRPPCFLFNNGPCSDQNAEVKGVACDFSGGVSLRMHRSLLPEASVSAVNQASCEADIGRRLISLSPNLMLLRIESPCKDETRRYMPSASSYRSADASTSRTSDTTWSTAFIFIACRRPPPRREAVEVRSDLPSPISLLARWVDDYDTARPHSLIGYTTPAAFAAELEKQRAGLSRPLLHPRSCATTMVGLWLPLDERRGARQYHDSSLR
jgi:hypothetical protein